MFKENKYLKQLEKCKMNENTNELNKKLFENNENINVLKENINKIGAQSIQLKQVAMN